MTFKAKINSLSEYKSWLRGLGASRKCFTNMLSTLAEVNPYGCIN